MKKHIIAYGLLTLCVFALLFVSLENTARRQQAMQTLEDVYASRLLETQAHLESISLGLTKAPAALDARMRVSLLTNISHRAGQVVSSLSALPLSHAAMADTIAFCNHLGEYALELALLAAGGQSASDAENRMLSQLENQCTLLGGQLATARTAMLSRSLRMTDSRNVFYQTAQADVRPLEQVAQDPGFASFSSPMPPRALQGEEISQQQAISIARRFVGEDRVAAATAGVPSDGALASWGVTLTLQDGSILNADVTRQGGKMLWLMPEHASFSYGLTLEECTAMAGRFLQEHGYGQMEAADYQVYNGMAVITFVAVQDGVLLYPDLLRVQLRMDTGELVGLESSQYLLNHTKRSSLSPALSKAQAQKKLSSRLEVSRMRLCVIPHDGAELLCWEASARWEENEYRIYLNANTGEEVEVRLIVNGENGRFAA